MWPSLLRSTNSFTG